MLEINGSPYGKNKIMSYAVYKHKFQMDGGVFVFLKRKVQKHEKNIKIINCEVLLKQDTKPISHKKKDW